MLKTYIQIKWKNLEEMDKFLNKYDHPKLNQENINYINRYITDYEIESVIKSLQKNKSKGSDRFSAGFYQTFKKNQ
jgi:glutamyl-tRNA reductase